MFSLISFLLLNCYYMMLYIGNTSSFPPPLSSREEQKYFARFQAGDIAAKNVLVERNLRLIAHIIKN